MSEAALLEHDGAPVPAPSAGQVTVVIHPDMARLLARLQQLRHQGACVTIDLAKMEIRVHGRVERLAGH